MMQTSTPSRIRLRVEMLILGIVGILLIALAVYLNYLDMNTFTLSKQSALQAIPSGTPTDPNPTAPITCNNQPMLPTDTCQHILTINGSSSTTDYTYTQQQHYQRDARIAQVESQRQKQRDAIEGRERPTFSLYGCLSPLICLLGVVLAMLGVASLRLGANARKARLHRDPLEGANPPTS